MDYVQLYSHQRGVHFLTILFKLAILSTYVIIFPSTGAPERINSRFDIVLEYWSIAFSNWLLKQTLWSFFCNCSCLPRFFTSYHQFRNLGEFRLLYRVFTKFWYMGLIVYLYRFVFIQTYGFPVVIV